MTQYLCAWQIDMDADSPEEAAHEAEEAMINRVGSIWTVTGPDGESKNCDVYDPGEDKP